MARFSIKKRGITEIEILQDRTIVAIIDKIVNFFLYYEYNTRKFLVCRIEL